MSKSTLRKKIQKTVFILFFALGSLLNTNICLSQTNTTCLLATNLGNLSTTQSVSTINTVSNQEYWYKFTNTITSPNNTLSFVVESFNQGNQGLEFDLYNNCSSASIYHFQDGPLVNQTDFYGIANQIPILLTIGNVYYVKIKRTGAPANLDIRLKLLMEPCPPTGFVLNENGMGINVYNQSRVLLNECVGIFPVSSNYTPTGISRDCNRLICAGTQLRFTFDEGFWTRRRYMPEYYNNVTYIWTVKYDDLNPATSSPVVTQHNIALWNVVGTNFNTMPTFDYNFNSNGIYTISYVVSGTAYPCGWPLNEISKEFTVYVGPPHVDLNPKPSATACFGQEVCFEPIINIAYDPAYFNSLPSATFDFDNIDADAQLENRTPQGSPSQVFQWIPDLCTNYSQGTYHPTFTSRNMCGTSTQSTTINMLSPALSISQVNNCTRTVAFTANTIHAQCLQNPSQYLWNFGDGTGNITSGTSGITHTFPSSGTYTVSVEYGGNTAITTVVIDLFPQPDINGATTACNTTTTGEQYTAAISGLGSSSVNYNYVWTITGGSFVNTASFPSTGNFTSTNLPKIFVKWDTSPINGQPNAGGNLTLTITNPATGCSTTKTIIVQPCCNLGRNILTLTKISELYPGTNSTSNAIISVNAPLIIDKSFTCSGCKFIMGESQTIELTPSTVGPIITQFQLVNSNVYACDKMWDYILAPDPKTEIRLESTFIEDGKNAIQSKNGGSIIAFNSTFNKNLNAIVLNNSTSPTISPLIVYGNTFTCKSGVTPYTNAGATLKAPYTTKNGFSGITFLDVTKANVGDRAQLLNTFELTQHGIYSINSGLLIKNNLFQEIAQPKNTKEKHIAIYSRGDIKVPTGLTVGGNLNRENNTFLNCDYGIVAENNNDLFIAYNSFNNINIYAINYFKNNDKEDVKIIYNNFTDVSVGVFAYSNTVSTNLISNNSLIQSAHGDGVYAGEVAVLISEPSKSASSVYTINNNTIKWFAEGIHLSVVQGAKVNNNTIRLDANEQGYGYGVYAEYNTLLTANNNSVVYMGASAKPYFKGFYIATTSNSSYTCNTVDKLEDGFYFEEDNFGTVLKTTGFSRNINHLHISGQTGLIGEQGTPYISPSNKAKVNDNNFAPGFGNINQTYTSNAAIGGNSNFYVRSTPFQLNPTANNSAQLTPITKTPYTNAQIAHPRLNCNVIQPPPGGLANGGGNKDLAHKIAKGLINYPLQAAGNQQSKQNLLEALKADPSFAQGDTVLTQFKDSMQTVPWGQISQALALMADSTQVFDSVRVAQANTIVQAQSPITTMETNFKQVNQIWLAALQNNTVLDSSQQQSIRTMAWLCPITDGPAVYQARALIHAYDTTYVNYRNACEAYSVPTVYARGAKQNEQETNQAENAINNNIEAEALYTQVYPNPSNTNVTIALLTKTPQKITIDIYNLLGEQMQHTTTETNGEALTFNTTSYTKGIYIVKITNVNGEVLETKKIIVSHD